MATTIPSPGPTGTPMIPCQAISFPTLDLSGLNGTVCAVSERPAFLNISSCCVGSVQVVNNCTQYCEADRDRFDRCLDGLGEGRFIPRLCQQAANQTQGNDSANPSQGGSGNDTMINTGSWTVEWVLVHARRDC